MEVKIVYKFSIIFSELCYKSYQSAKIQEKWPKKVTFVDWIKPKTSLKEFFKIQLEKNGEKILCRPGLGPKNKELAGPGPGPKTKTLQGPNRDPEKLKAPGLVPGPMEKGIAGTEPGPGLKILGPANL